jgi:hypothetical protein
VKCRKIARYFPSEDTDHVIFLANNFVILKWWRLCKSREQIFTFINKFLSEKKKTLQEITKITAHADSINTDSNIKYRLISETKLVYVYVGGIKTVRWRRSIVM